MGRLLPEIETRTNSKGDVECGELSFLFFDRVWLSSGHLVDACAISHSGKVWVCVHIHTTQLKKWCGYRTLGTHWEVDGRWKKKATREERSLKSFPLENPSFPGVCFRALFWERDGLLWILTSQKIISVLHAMCYFKHLRHNCEQNRQKPLLLWDLPSDDGRQNIINSKHRK